MGRHSVSLLAVLLMLTASAIQPQVSGASESPLHASATNLPAAPAGFYLLKSEYVGLAENSDIKAQVLSPLTIEVRFVGPLSQSLLLWFQDTCSNNSSNQIFPHHDGLYVIPGVKGSRECTVEVFIGAAFGGSQGKIGVQILAQSINPTTTSTTTTTPTAPTNTTTPTGTPTTTTTTKPKPKPKPKPGSNPCPVETLNCKFPYDGSYSGALGGTITITAQNPDGADAGSPSVGASILFAGASVEAQVSEGVLSNLTAYEVANPVNGQYAVFYSADSSKISNSGLATGLTFDSSGLIIGFDPGNSGLTSFLTCSPFSAQFNATGAGTSDLICTGTNYFGENVQFTGSINLNHLIPTA